MNYNEIPLVSVHNARLMAMKYCLQNCWMQWLSESIERERERERFYSIQSIGLYWPHGFQHMLCDVCIIIYISILICQLYSKFDLFCLL